MVPPASGSRRVLALVRHAEFHRPMDVPSAHLPYGLTALGASQATRAASVLLQFAREQELALDGVIDCSTLRRAWETARCLALELGSLTGVEHAVHEFAELAERSLGAAANLRRGEIEAVVGADPRFEVPPTGWQRDPTYRLPLPGAESLDEAGARVARHIELRTREPSATPTLKIIVGHGAAFRHAACHLGVLERGRAAHVTLEHAAPIYLERRSSSGAAARMTHIAGHWRERVPEGAP